jgi:hypothetical protein
VTRVAAWRALPAQHIQHHVTRCTLSLLSASMTWRCIFSTAAPTMTPPPPQPKSPTYQSQADLPLVKTVICRLRHKPRFVDHGMRLLSQVSSVDDARLGCMRGLVGHALVACRDLPLVIKKALRALSCMSANDLDTEAISVGEDAHLALPGPRHLAQLPPPFARRQCQWLVFVGTKHECRQCCPPFAR